LGPQENIEPFAGARLFDENGFDGRAHVNRKIPWTDGRARCARW
jgi:hypothetical protein